MLPAGIILLWSGSLGSIPTGYVLCDGNNGTPDLRDKFVVGAGDTYAVDATGGNTQHLHSFLSITHSHIIGIGGDLNGGANFNATTSSVQVAGNTGLESNLPPYHSLAYIMKT